MATRKPTKRKRVRDVFALTDAEAGAAIAAVQGVPAAYVTSAPRDYLRAAFRAVAKLRKRARSRRAA